MTAPKVSVIMPAFNAAMFIEESIESVIAQTYENWELIIVDDGSTDETAKIVMGYASANNKIKYYYKENERQAIARNYGTERAMGEVIAFLDADDVWLNTRLEVGIRHFNTCVYDLFFSDSYYSKNDNRMTVELDKRMGVKDYIYEGNNALKRFLESNRVPTLTVLVKKSILIESGGFDKELVPAEDYDLWIRLLKSGCKFLAISTPLAIYRIQGNSSTANDRYASDRVLLLLQKNFSKSQIQELGSYNYLKNWINRGGGLSSNYTKNSMSLQLVLMHFGLYGKKMKFLFFVRRAIPNSWFIKAVNKLL
jgi:teichuronic acid biosynthesis glycosyltransferase TuaG